MPADPADSTPQTDKGAHAPRPRARSRPGRMALMRGLAILVWVGMLVFVPFAEKLELEKSFALAIVGCATLILLFATARASFSLLNISLLVITLATASMLKLEFLLTPVLAPDLKYYINLESLDWLVRYPMLLAVTGVALILVPALLVLAWKWDEVPVAWTLRQRRAVLMRGLDLVEARHPIARAAAATGCGRNPRRKHLRSAHSQGLHNPAMLLADVPAGCGYPRQRPAHRAYLWWWHLDQRIRPGNRPC